MVEQRVALANQLRSLLEGFWPGAAVIFADIDSPISLCFISKYPTPASAGRLGEKGMVKFMKANAYCGRRSAVELLARLHAAPSGLAGPTEAQASGEMVSAQLRVLIPLVNAIARLTARIEDTVAELPDGKIIMSFPRAGQICAAQILVELGDVRERFLSDDQLAAEAGVSPVTHASGKSHSVVFRRACNTNLRAAITCFADNSRHASLWAAEIYRNAKARGCKHAHAVRILARAWVRIIWRAWQDKEPYDLTKHVAAAKITAS
jgi:hypothetical protein